MKKTILLLALITTFIFNQNVFGQATDLIFSEYIEGTSNNKALEVYNGTGAAVDLADYELWRISNGGDWPENEYPLSGTLIDGGVYVIANSSAGPEILAVADTTNGATWFNGNDAIGLAKNIGGTMTLIDAIGMDGPDLGNWDVAGIAGATAEHTLVRKADICSPTTDWATSAGTNATDSQWIVYDQNEFSYLGDHVSSCTGPVPLNANFTADNTTVLSGSSVNFTDISIGGTEPYSYAWDLDGDGSFDDAFVANPSFMYNTAGTYDVSLRVTDDDTNVDTETKVGYITVVTPIEVANLAALRAGTLGEIYKVTGEVVLTYQMSFRNQKYIQDASAGVLIDDYDGIITTTYNIYDGITGLVGTLGEYGNMTQFVPYTNPGPATTGYIPTPVVVTIDDLNDSFDDYEAELVKLIDVSFADANGDTTFTNGQVYPISDGSAFGHFRTTFYYEDYIGTIIPDIADIVVLPNARDTINIVTCRTLADFVVESNTPTQLAVIEVNGGADPYENNDFSVVVQAQDAGGNPAIVAGDVIFNFTTNDPFNVDFTVSSTLMGTIISGTSQATVTGVQMAPAGTNVTITATDDDPAGLDMGTSLPFDVLELIIPDIIITEVMQNPDSVGDNNGEWYEVYNNTDAPVDMIGWIMRDLGTNEHTILSSLIVPTYGYAVLGNDANPATNGGYTCDYEFSNFALGNSDDEIILYLPDGITEVDRIEWDGGPIWPDPHGASMVYTGVPSEDNNNGAIWGQALSVEDTYTNMDGDLGSPGSEGEFQVLTEGFSLDVQVLLEGYYVANDSMNNYYRSNSLLPLEQPYNPTLPYYGNNSPEWLYTGMESTGYLPYFTTDWIIVELWDGFASGKVQHAAVVEVDGQVCSYNGAERLSVKTDFFNDMLIAVYHLNHLGIISSTGITVVEGTVVSYDFTTGADKVMNGSLGYKELETGTWGMVAGDINGDGTVDATDKTSGWAPSAGAEGAYQGNNLYPDEQINNMDKNEIWAPNMGTSSQIPN